MAMCRALTALLFVATIPALSAQYRDLEKDESDWWSELNPNTETFDGQIQKRVFKADNLYILGLTPLAKESDDWLRAKLGPADGIFRGDGGNSRVQVCYTSVKRDVYLISESGETNLGFYVLARLQPWRGQELCRVSSMVTKGIATRSGLRIGLTPSQVKAILGRPSVERRGLLYYASEVKIPTSPGTLEEFIKRNPSYSKTDIVNDLPEHYDLSVSVTIRFTAGRLTYLHVDKSEIN
jgi:hypothetical protein